MQGKCIHKNKLYFQIGLYVASKHPDLASEIVSKYLHTEAKDVDLEHMPQYYYKFEQYLEHRVTDIFSQRKLFVSAMLRIYTPGVYNQHQGNITMSKYGLVKAISRLVGIKEPRVSQVIRQVITFERVYEDYRTQVDELVQFITLKTEEKSKIC